MWRQQIFYYFNIVKKGDRQTDRQTKSGYDTSCFTVVSHQSHGYNALVCSHNKSTSPLSRVTRENSTKLNLKQL